MITHSRAGKIFSANVKLYLHVLGRQIELGQVGPGFALLRTASNVDASTGELETIVDGKSSRWKVRFTSPITAASRRFTFTAV